jgi:hypothetical protein
LAVTARVSAAGALHRATNDIDLVTIYLEPDPEAAELIASAQGADARPLLVNGVKVDIIPTRTWLTHSEPDLANSLGSSPSHQRPSIPTKSPTPSKVSSTTSGADG